MDQFLVVSVLQSYSDRREAYAVMRNLTNKPCR